MKTLLLALAILFSVHIQPPAASADGGVDILPGPFADRTFQYVKIAETFLGTPLKTDALVPNILIVVSRREDPDLVLQAANIAYMIGQWTHEPGTSVEKVKSKADLGPVRFDTDLTEEDIKGANLLVLGKNNILYEKIADRLTGQGSYIQVIPDGAAAGRDVMFIADREAAAYLANQRLYFKSGAYRGFFNFVRSRLLLERENYEAALFLLDDPDGIRGCGKPVILTIGHKEKLPAEMLRIAEKRNNLVFKELRMALEERNKSKAADVWQQAMATCYTCHQGDNDVPRYRKFIPGEGEHAYHQLLVKQSGFACDLCHKGNTSRVGYTMWQTDESEK